jgi:DNA-binding LacI/PurR family transcriptional regulator
MKPGKKRKRERVTIRTVAEDSGVSVAAVSKVLRDAYGVSDSLRARVQASMALLGYRPHTAARGMRGQTYTLGILLNDIRNPFYPDMLDGVNTALSRTQYQALIGMGQAMAPIETALVDAMVDRQMDGIIMIGPRMSVQEVAIVAARIPTVTIGHHEPNAVTFDTVNNDDVLGAKLVVRHLVAGGYRNIVMLSMDLPGLGETVVISPREVGYRTAMEEAGLTRYINVIAAPETAREVRAVSKHLLQMRYRPEAVFCWSDYFAFEFLSVAKELGVQIPNDLGVVGYDNSSYCDLAQNALTSVDQSGQLLGLQAARLLIERIAGRETAEHFVVTPRLVARASSNRLVGAGS